MAPNLPSPRTQLTLILSLDVYGENVRICVPVDSPEFGRVMIICVGAMMVGSTVITAKAGQQVKRTDELGYFQFGKYHSGPSKSEM